MTALSRREIAVSFLQLAASGKVREAYDKYVGKNFRHHNPFFRGDRESLMLAMEESAAKNPNKKLEIKLVLEDGDLVATYSRVQQNPEDLGGAVVHIFRLEGDLIAEMWDIGQAVPGDAVNENGMF
jgi:predicted SnoaL-like aldol condensation-catalyzing enzyme